MEHSDHIDAQIQALRFYLTAPHDCHYIDGETAVTLFVDPNSPMTAQIYTHLSALGFRRSGRHVYRPHCPNCRACLPLRVPVDRFQPNRSQRRILRRNANLRIEQQPAVFDAQHYRLYRKYMTARHPGSGMDHDDPEAYHHILNSEWGNTVVYSIYQNRELRAVAITDLLDDGLSAVYTFFDTDYPDRSLGTYAILAQIEQAQQQGLDWLYLGYWVETCQKMAYKAAFLPHQTFDGARWQEYEGR